MEPLSAERRLMVVLGCIVLCTTVGLLDYYTGERMDFFVLYFIPVALATWHTDRTTGVYVSMIATCMWFMADLLTSTRYILFIGLWDTLIRGAAFLLITTMLARIRGMFEEEKALNDQLSVALAEIKQLSGILPMCSICKKIRNAEDRWVPLEMYITNNSEAQVSHGLCPHCYRKYYGDPNGT